MFESKKYYINSERGFALVVALIACMILIALGALVIALSTGDLKTSSQVMADKRAMAAAEKGINRLTQTFDPTNLANTITTTVTDDSNADAHSLYTISTPVIPTTGPSFLPMAGYNMGGGQTFGLTRFNVDVTGKNTAYNTSVTIRAGVGYGPVEMTTMSR
jgi:hypothetical protein